MSQSTVNSDATNQTDVPVEEVDLLVVGGGKAGKSLAMLRAKAGDKVVMVERDKVGGTCINVACIPTKTLISAARVLREVQGSQTYGVTLPEQDGGADALAQARIELAPSAPARRPSWAAWWPPTRRCSPPPAWTSSRAPPASWGSAPSRSP